MSSGNIDTTEDEETQTEPIDFFANIEFGSLTEPIAPIPLTTQKDINKPSEEIEANETMKGDAHQKTENLEQKDLPDSIAHKEKLCLGMGDATEFILAKARADGNTAIEKLIIDSGFEETAKVPQEETDPTTPNPTNGAAAEDVDEPGLTGETPEQATDFP